MATVNLSFLNRRTINKQVCRICQEFTELKHERLCGECTRIKTRLRSGFPDAERRMASSTEQQCKRLGCVCAACGGGTLDHHSLYLANPARANRAELHFHPRCHELWLELGSGARLDTRLGSSQA
jgi:hypothetical protein